jgi:hypothetical protein
VRGDPVRVGEHLTGRVQDRAGAHVGRQLAQVFEAVRGGERARHLDRLRAYGAVPLSRIAWLVTVATCFVAVILLVVADYFGYAAVTGAVGLSAAINLR